MPKRVAIIEDDSEILEMLQFSLKAEGFATSISRDGVAGLQLVQQEPPDLLLLDLMLPGMDGLELCRRLKASPRTENVPIIMVTAKDHESDIILGLGLGADDYICKPFSVRELIARIKAVLRRSSSASEPAPRQIVRHGLVIDADKYEVLVDGEPAQLQPAEFRLLYLLASQPGRVMTREQILELTADEDSVALPHSLEVRIAEIRKKLGSYRRLIETVWSVGYRFRDEEE